MAEAASEEQRGVEALRQRTKEQRAIVDARTVHRFTVPKRLVNGGVQELGLVQITSAEELRATKRAGNDQHRLAFELAMQSLVEVDGQPLSEADGTKEKAWDKMHPKIRTLAVTAYGHLHVPEDDDINDFLKSQRVEVG